MLHRRLVILLLALVLVVPYTPASAQEESATEYTSIAEMPGLLSSVSRMYQAPMMTEEETMAMMEASPMPPTEAIHTSVNFVDIGVWEFDTPQNASAAYDVHVRQYSSGMVYAQPDAQQVTTVETLPGIGAKATRIENATFSPGMASNIEYVIVLRDTYVFSVFSTGVAFDMMGTADDVATPELPTVDIASDLAANGQPSEDPATLVTTGLSSGGLWGFMPAPGEGSIPGELNSLRDAVNFPYTGGWDVVDPTAIPGIISAVSRVYMLPDPGWGESFSEASPASEASNVVTTYAFMNVSVYQYETAELAAAGYDALKSNTTGNLMRVEGPSKVLGSFENVDGVGDQAVRIQQAMIDPWSVSLDETIVIQNDTFLISVNLNAHSYNSTGMENEDIPLPELPTLDVATSIAMDSQPSPDEVVFNQDGLSTGGLWGMVPAEGDARVPGLEPFRDLTAYPIPPWYLGRVDIADMPGLQEGVMRTYGGDNTFVGSQEETMPATPVSATDLAQPSIGFSDARVYQFDTPANAEIAFENEIRNVASDSTTMDGSTRVVVTTEMVPSLGEDAVRLRVDETQERGTSSMEIVMFQRDNLIVVVTSSADSGTFGEASASAADAELPTLAIAEEIFTNGQPGTESATFVENGTSSGGIWDMMPAPDSEALVGLTAQQDVQLHPAP